MDLPYCDFYLLLSHAWALNLGRLSTTITKHLYGESHMARNSYTELLTLLIQGHCQWNEPFQVR